MKGSLVRQTLERALDLLVPAPDPPVAGTPDQAERSAHERFALPYVFRPRLSFFEACLEVFAALLKIFFGSLLFAFWGAYSYFLWSTVSSVFLRVIVLLPLLVVFLVLFALLMIAITAAARLVSKHL
jgi:hypothetical protein